VALGGNLAVPEKNIVAIRHKRERPKALLLCNRADIFQHLLLAGARLAAGAFGFNDGKDFAVFAVKAVIGNTLERLGIISRNGDSMPTCARSRGSQSAFRNCGSMRL
jgi:hypothetical protein